MGKEFKPLTVQDFGLSPEEMKTLVLGSRLFAGPQESEPETYPPPAKPAEESDDAERSDR